MAKDLEEQVVRRIEEYIAANDIPLCRPAGSVTFPLWEATAQDMELQMAIASLTPEQAQHIQALFDDRDIFDPAADDEDGYCGTIRFLNLSRDADGQWQVTI